MGLDFEEPLSGFTLRLELGLGQWGRCCHGHAGVRQDTPVAAGGGDWSVRVARPGSRAAAGRRGAARLAHTEQASQRRDEQQATRLPIALVTRHTSAYSTPGRASSNPGDSAHFLAVQPGPKAELDATREPKARAFGQAFAFGSRAAGFEPPKRPCNRVTQEQPEQFALSRV